MCHEIMDRNMVLQLESSWSSVRSYSMSARYIQKIPITISCKSSMLITCLNLTMMSCPLASLMIFPPTSIDTLFVSFPVPILMGLGSVVVSSAAHCTSPIANGMHETIHSPTAIDHNNVMVKYFFSRNSSLNT